MRFYAKRTKKSSSNKRRCWKHITDQLSRQIDITLVTYFKILVYKREVGLSPILKIYKGKFKFKYNWHQLLYNLFLFTFLNFWFNSWIQILIKQTHFILVFQEFLSYLFLCNSKFKSSQNLNHQHLLPKTTSYKLNLIQHPSNIQVELFHNFVTTQKS